MPSLNLELVVSVPKGSPLARHYVEGVPEALEFFRGHHARLAAYQAKAEEVDGRFDTAARRRASGAIRVPAGGDPERLERWVDEGGFVVTTGQQPGLFGGPLYSLYKALTAIRLAQVLEERLGRPVLPLFWVASEDHDWAEANHTSVVGMDNELRTPTLEAPDAGVHPALHRIPLGPDFDALRESFLNDLPASDFSAPYFDLLRNAAKEGMTLPASFSGIMEALLGPLGLYFTDAADPALKDASVPLLLSELDRSPELEGVLDATGRRLIEAGYELQVALMEGGVNLFLEGPAGRERIYREESGYRLRISGEQLTRDDIAARVQADPSVLSPNVLLRPVVESAVFPTLSYVAGPGETAYFGQLGDYFEAHGIRMPVIHPRFGATAVEAKIRKVLDKFGLDVPALDRPFHEISSEIARDEVPEEVKTAVGALRGTVARGVGELNEAVKAIDPTLKGPVQHVRSQTFAALDELEKKVVHALKRENEIALAQLEKAQLHLFPLGKPQERVLNPFYYLTRYGGAFLEGLLERFSVNPQ
ncbi:MAG TPA: bacillithiol biosynthesis cysteine-adding enzyme BshC [Longimicrobiales bacterium]|nr:bacillithiol biosynthesis cysteine-adding enzyme BshC [Longimicrobiales bacterium]